VRVTDATHLAELSAFFDLAMHPGTSSWHLGVDGGWERHAVDADGQPLIDLQDMTMGLIQRRRRARAAR